jgi:hypothetical protein
MAAAVKEILAQQAAGKASVNKDADSMLGLG